MTSDGKPKIIERFDCSGAGDVDTSKVVQAPDGFITGLTGRKLKVCVLYTVQVNFYCLKKDIVLYMKLRCTFFLFIT